MSEERRRLFRWVGRGLIVLGFAGYLLAIVTNGFRTAPGLAAFQRAARPHWVTYRDATGAFQIDYLSHWQIMQPMEKWTERTVGPLTASDRVGFRYHDPFAFASIIIYRSPRPRTEEEWFDLVRTVPELAASFGENAPKARPVFLPDETHALEVRAEGPLHDRTFRFRSLFVPRGEVAYRVTMGADTRDWGRIGATLDTMLLSFRAPALPARPPTTPSR